MATDASGRPVLQHHSSLPGYSFAPTTMAPRENQKNYVFVDEHNRHKRLKVMRACEGCRRRKIKCDAATTNTWPCSACVRLKLNCVPPSVNYDKDFALNSQTFDLNGVDPYDTSLDPNDDAFNPQVSLGSSYSDDALAHSFGHSSNDPYIDEAQLFPPSAFLDHDTTLSSLQFAGIPATPAPLPEPRRQMSTAMYSGASGSPLPSPRTDGTFPMSSLADALGDLKIETNAVANYIANQKKSLAETPAMEEYEVEVPVHNTPDHIVAVPPEMMPNDQQAMRYFEYFFANIHPYLPVINRSYFYQQWQKNRQSISPLILEAIFACASRMMDDQSRSDKWLAVFSKHEESFRDVPRLSTIQAMILVLKAREGVPKRGYYYRSWMTMVNLVTMAKDLDLHVHYEHHRSGKRCDANQFDCVTKTRVWHTLFFLEPMVGAVQGRSDFGVDMDTIDFGFPRASAGHDDVDLQVSKNFAYILRITRNVTTSVRLLIQIRKTTKEWALDPRFVQHNQVFPAWPQDLPREFQIFYPADGSTPWIPSHYVANFHVYHHLGVIMQHRPQFHFLSERGDPAWRHHMMLCYAAAKSMCRLQEAILQNYGLGGLACMVRGLGFTVYSVITCVMLHLVAITSPDPELSTDARDFFTRHMRVLERCSASWPMADVQTQINSLREAFSADTSKPFELKPSFPFGSPIPTAQPSPLSSNDGYRSRGPSADAQSGHYLVQPITPPLSVKGADLRADSPADQSLVMAAPGYKQLDSSQLVPKSESVDWNPTRIFQQWNTAFGTISDKPSEPSPPLKPGVGGYYNVPSVSESPMPNFSRPLSISSASGHVHNMQSAAMASSAAYASTGPQYVTPSMWQEAVASSFGNGLKRGWDYGVPSMVDQSPKRFK